MASECTVLVDEFSLERWLGDGDQKNVETLKKFNKFCLDDFIRVSFWPFRFYNSVFHYIFQLIFPFIN